MILLRRQLHTSTLLVRLISGTPSSKISFPLLFICSLFSLLLLLPTDCWTLRFADTSSITRLSGRSLLLPPLLGLYKWQLLHVKCMRALVILLNAEKRCSMGLRTPDVFFLCRRFVRVWVWGKKGVGACTLPLGSSLALSLFDGRLDSKGALLGPLAKSD